MKKQIGGQRIGSGNKMETDLHNYGRSTHNLARSWKSTAAPGTLIPFLVEPAMNGDTFDIDLNAMARTLPTVGPLFSTYKLQMDVYTIPMRLYQGILHNNPINIGMDMSKVLMPQMKLRTIAGYKGLSAPMDLSQIAPTALIKYLGVSGIGRNADQEHQAGAWVERNFWGMPMLAYYDVFKQYYSNKQEPNAYVIMPYDINEAQPNISRILYKTPSGVQGTVNVDTFTTYMGGTTFYITGRNLTINNILVSSGGAWYSVEDLIVQNKVELYTNTETQIDFSITEWNFQDIKFKADGAKAKYEIKLQEFPLDNIDRMRRELLSMQTLGQRYTIEKSTAFLPYKAVVDYTDDGLGYNAFPQNGLCVKTYQSDLFNNWINTEWIDGDNGISAITSVDTSNGYFTIDAFNLASKVYAFMNRVAVSGGTYEDWQEAAWGEEALRHAESPVYVGGMSSEIVFEEVVTTAETQTNSGINKAGSLAGKGTLSGRKGGNITVKIKEPSIIMGIVSITPRIEYTQGNKWFMTELDNMDNLHKPALDAIGFQESMVEQRAWFDVAIAPNSSTIVHRGSAGKVPAWINYMTAVDEAYGDFADANKCQYMILARNYEYDENVGVADLTTYIDPTKYNYAFAYTQLDSQNMWLQIHSNIIARRIMSAKVIPNL